MDRTNYDFGSKIENMEFTEVSRFVLVTHQGLLNRYIFQFPRRWIAAARPNFDIDFPDLFIQLMEERRRAVIDYISGDGYIRYLTEEEGRELFNHPPKGVRRYKFR